MQIVAVPVLGILLNLLLQCIEANLALDFKITKISANHKPANCNVANTTYAHGETFKLDCKTQCVCENGRHACSTLCPKEQLPAPEDTISCRSPRLVDVPGHCCKMWLCENPTADVYATCHNSSTSPWTPCSRKCGLGISTRFTTTTAGCNQLSNLRLCENRKCEIQQQQQQQDNTEQQIRENKGHRHVEKPERETRGKRKHLMETKQLKYKLKRQQRRHRQKYHSDSKHQEQLQHGAHRIRKGHECRSLQRLGPARIRLGQCVSKKLYRPKICGRCHRNTKCCVPSVSTTIQVELLCPLNAMDPISFVQQQLQTEQQHGKILNTETPTSSNSFTSSSPSPSPSSSSSSLSSSSLTSLWDTLALDAIDQEYLQSHQIQITNKFIAVEWILKCECTKNDNCQRIVNTTNTAARGENSHQIKSSSSSSSNNINNHKYHDYDDRENIESGNNFHNNKNMQNINYFKLKQNNNNKWKNFMHHADYKQQLRQAAATQIDKIPDDNKNVDEHDDVKQDVNANEDNGDNDSDININDSYTNINRHMHSLHNHKKQTKDYADNGSNDLSKQNNEEDMHNHDEKEQEWSAASSEGGGVAAASDEIQPDIIPYPPLPFSANKHTGKDNKHNNSNSNNNKNNNNNNRNNKIAGKNSKTNWIKEKFQLEHSKQTQPNEQQHKQQLYEHWLLQQYNNQPYHTERLAT